MDGGCCFRVLVCWRVGLLPYVTDNTLTPLTLSKTLRDRTINRSF